MARHKRILAISDLHCGSVVGLTPPGYQVGSKEGGRTKREKWSRLQREMWSKWLSMLASVAPIDGVLYGGDGIDGPGKRSGGTEQITTDREEQADICVRCIDTIRLYARSKRGGIPIVGVYGTPYHVSGDGEDWENVVAERAGFAKIGSHEWPEVEGVVFDLKHKIGSSAVPHGRHTATSREMLWNDLWSMERLQPSARVLLRGHVHYHQFCGTPTRLGMTLPALQAMGTKYGGRQCSGLVHWGAVTFDCAGGELLDWRSHIMTIKAQIASTTEI